MPTKILYEEFHKAIQKIYGSEFGVLRAKNWLSEFNHLPNVVTDIPALNKLEYIPVLLRTICHIGILYNGRRYFLAFVVLGIAASAKTDGPGFD